MAEQKDTLAELRRLLSAAHPLPWGEVGGVRGGANRKLVVAAVNALPGLLDVVEAAKRMRSVAILTAEEEDDFDVALATLEGDEGRGGR